MASFGIRLLPKDKTLGTGLFLITSQIEWYKLHSHSAYCTEVMVLCLQRCKAAEISAYICIFSALLSRADFDICTKAVKLL